MFAAPTVPKSGQGVLLQHCRVSFMTHPLHLNMMIRQTVSHDLVYPQRVSRLTYTAPVFGLAVLLRLFHAGRRDIPAMRGEPYDDRGVYHGVVL